MPVAKRKVNPAHLQAYYQRTGKSAPAQIAIGEIARVSVSRSEKRSAVRTDKAALMVSGGLCKSLG